MIDNRVATVTVVGLGIVGTSIALALREQGIRVLLTDRDDRAVDIAVRRGAGDRLAADDDTRADLSVIAVPATDVAQALQEAQSRDLTSVYTDVSSVKAAPLRDAEALGCDLTKFVPGHPIANGVGADVRTARADLFRGQGWMLCPNENTRPEAVAVARMLAELCGAVPVLMDAETHDQVAALILHAPYLVASTVAAALASSRSNVLWLGHPVLLGLTNLATGDPVECTEVLKQNAKWVSSVLSDIAANLFEACAALQLAGAGDDSFVDDVTELLRLGHAGRRRLARATRPGSAGMSRKEQP